MYQPFVIQSYAGLNEDENPAALRSDQLREATNCARLGNLTGTRPGLVRDSEYDDTISGTPPIQGIYEFRNNRDSNRSLVVVAGGSVYTDDTTSLTLSSATISSGADYMWTFANYQNLLWAAGGQQGTDSIWSWDGSGNVTGRLSSLGLSPLYVFQKFNTLFLGGLDGTDAWDNPLVARYCDLASDATDPLSWPNSNTIPGQLIGENSGPGSYGNEYHTGFGSFQDNKGDFLLFLTNRRIFAFQQRANPSSNANRFLLTDSIATGCVNQRAFVDLGFDQGDAVYISTQGIHSMALSQQFGNRANYFLSWPIRKTWETINRGQQDKFCGAYWPDEGIVLFAVATGSSTHLDTILCMDIKGVSQISPETVRWSKWHVDAIDINMLTVARDSDGKPRIYCGGQGGDVAPFSRSSYSDLGNSFGVAFRGRDEDYGAPMTEKSIGDTFLMLRGSGTYQPTISYSVDDGSKIVLAKPLEVSLPGFVLDNASGSLSGASALDNASGTLPGAGTLGSSSQIRRERVVAYGSGYTVSHRFSHAGNNEPFFVGQVSQEIAADGIADEAAA